MVSKGRLADRRSDVRFEIIGHLWGSLMTVESLLLRNIGRGGALVESRRPLTAAPVHSVHLIHDAGTATIRAKVRHVTPIVSPSGVARYLIGFEFLDLEETALEQIDNLVAASGGPPTPSTEPTDLPAGSRERRRFPRATVASARELRLPSQMTVQLLDISAGGVAIAAPHPVEPDACAQLQASLGADHMLVDLEVRWVAPVREPGTSGGRYRLGARLVSTDETRRSIERILRNRALQ
jgi:c-di-GMP-binding flagellar brake protein YcgR